MPVLLDMNIDSYIDLTGHTITIIVFIIGFYKIYIDAKISRKKELNIKMYEIISNNVFQTTRLMEKIRFEYILLCNEQLNSQKKDTPEIPCEKLRVLNEYKSDWNLYASFIPKKFRDLKFKIEKKFESYNKELDKKNIEKIEKINDEIDALITDWCELLSNWGDSEWEKYSL